MLKNVRAVRNLVKKGNILKGCLNYYEGYLETKELKLDSEDWEDELYFFFKIKNLN